MILQDVFHLNGLATTHYMIIDRDPFIMGVDLEWSLKKTGQGCEVGWEEKFPYLIALDTNEITEENKNIWYCGVILEPEIIYFLKNESRKRELLDVLQSCGDKRYTVLFDTDLLTRRDYIEFIKSTDEGLEYLKKCNLFSIDLVKDYDAAIEILRENPYAYRDMENYSDFNFILNSTEKDLIIDAMEKCNNSYLGNVTVKLQDEHVLDLIKNSPAYIKNLTTEQLKLPNVREYIINESKSYSHLYDDLTYAEATDCLSDCREIFKFALNKFFINLTREDIQNLLVLYVMQGNSFDPKIDWKAMKELVEGTDLVLFLLTKCSAPAMIFANFNEVGYKFTLQQEIVLFFDNIDNLSLIDDVNENLCKLYADDLEEITDNDFKKTIPARFKTILNSQVMRMVYNNLF